jgi:cyclophilin family peptidyl-prolyl cis-trans isomerase
MNFPSRIRLGVLAGIAAVTLGAGSALAASIYDVNVLMKTSHGDIQLRLDAKAAPVTVANFVKYAKSGFFDNLIFHRVIDGFMIQGGGFDENMRQKDTQAPIVNEARNGLSNRRGTIAMARTSEPHSASSQFFINLVDNDFLDAKNARDGWGYAVFGRVVKGMNVVDKIGSVRTTIKRGHSDVPVDTVKIQSVTVMP